MPIGQLASPVRRRLLCLAGLILLLVVIALPYRWVPTLDWTGVDAAPLIQSARLDREGALERIFLGEMRGDSRVASSFFRPLTSLSFGLDHILARDNPSGYHRTDVLLHLLAVVALWYLVAAFTGTRSLAPWITAFVFGIHPLQLETVPAIARRSEILATIFLLLAALGAARWGQFRSGAAGVEADATDAEAGATDAEADADAGGGRRWFALYLASCVLAPLSKELGFLAVAVGTVAFIVSSWEGSRHDGGLFDQDRRAWLRSVFRLVVAGVLCTIPVALLRTRALGGAGGYADFMDLGVRDFVAAAFDLLDPWRLLSWRGDLLLVAVIVAMAVLLIRSDRELRRPLLLGVAFIVIPLALFAAAGVLFPWYMYAPTAGLAMILGTLAASVPSLVGWRRLSAAMASAVAVVVLTASASWSEAPWEWRAVSDLTKLARQRLEESARTCSAEDPIYVAFLPHRVLPRAGETGLQAASGGRDYSFSAMLALEGLSKEVRAVSYLTVSGPTDQIHTRVSDSAGGFILAVEGPARIERPWNQDVVLQSDPQPGSWVEARGFRYAQREAGLEVVWDGNIGSPCVQLSILN